MDRLDITPPHFLVLMVLWEKGRKPVSDIARKRSLNINTMIPLLKGMEQQEMIERRQSEDDERKVIVQLTEKGIGLKGQAVKTPEELVNRLLKSGLHVDELIQLKNNLHDMISLLSGRPVF